MVAIVPTSLCMDFGLSKRKCLTDFVENFLCSDVLIQKNRPPAIANDYPAPGIIIVSNLVKPLFCRLDISFPGVLMAYLVTGCEKG